SIGRDVAADAVMRAVRADDHGHRVPAQEALDAALDFPVAWITRLAVRGNRVDVRRVQREGESDAGAARLVGEHAQEIPNPLRTVAVERVLERLEPLPRLRRIYVLHHSIGDHGHRFLLLDELRFLAATEIGPVREGMRAAAVFEPTSFASPASGSRSPRLGGPACAARNGDLRRRLARRNFPRKVPDLPRHRADLARPRGTRHHFRSQNMLTIYRASRPFSSEISSPGGKASPIFLNAASRSAD